MVLHEMALSGLPLLASVEVGASSRLLQPQVNGLNFEPTVQGVRDALMGLFRMSADDLTQLGEESRVLALSETPEKWVNTLLALV